MPKVTLTDLSAGFGSVGTINANNTTLETAFDNTLSLDGSTPNTMSADLDMGSQEIINLADPTTNNSATNKSYVDSLALGSLTDVTFDTTLTVTNTLSDTIVLEAVSTATQSTTEGPIISLYRSGTAGATDHVAGALVFNAKDSGGTKTEMARIKLATEDMTDTSETGGLTFDVKNAGGALTEAFRIEGNGDAYFNSSDLFVDNSLSAVGINTVSITTGFTLDVNGDTNITGVGVSSDALNVSLDDVGSQSTVGPVIAMRRTFSDGAAANDFGPAIYTYMDSDTGVERHVFDIYTQWGDPANGFEDAISYFQQRIAGANINIFRAGDFGMNLNRDVYIGDATSTPSAALHVSDSTNTVAILESTLGNGSSAGPRLELNRDDTGLGAPNDVGGSIYWQNINDAGTLHPMSELYQLTETASAGLEDSSLTFTTHIGGSASNMMRISGATQSVTIPRDTKIGGLISDTPGARLHVVDSVTDDVLRVESTAASSGDAKPEIMVYSNGGAATSGHSLGGINFCGNDDVGGFNSYAAIYGAVPNAGAGSEEGGIVEYIQSGGGTITATTGKYGAYTSTTQDFGIGMALTSTVPSARLHVSDTTPTVAKFENTGTTNVAANFTHSTDNCSVFAGTGDPESSITANVGSLFLRTDGAANTALYVKETGTGNTGWSATFGGGGNFKGENGETNSNNLGDIFRVHEQTLNTDTTIDADENALCAGPLTVASGTTLTVTSGGNLVIA